MTFKKGDHKYIDHRNVQYTTHVQCNSLGRSVWKTFRYKIFKLNYLASYST